MAEESNETVIYLDACPIAVTINISTTAITNVQDFHGNYELWLWMTFLFLKVSWVILLKFFLIMFCAENLYSMLSLVVVFNWIDMKSGRNKGWEHFFLTQNLYVISISAFTVIFPILVLSVIIAVNSSAVCNKNCCVIQF